VKKIITAPDAPAPRGPYSQAVQAGNLLFTAGQLPLDPKTGQIVEGGIEAQTQQVLENLKAILHAADLDFSHAVKVNVYMDDIANRSAINHIYANYFPTDPPARTSIEVSALPMDSLVEMELIALLDS